MTIPLRRYHTPSLVRQTSSASIFPPLVNIITGLPPWRVAIPGPLVDTGSVVERECEVAVRVDSDFGDSDGDGDGDGEGETTGDGEGCNSAVGDGTAGATSSEFWVAAEVFCAFRLKA